MTDYLEYSKEMYDDFTNRVNAERPFIAPTRIQTNLLLDEIARLNTENARLTTANKWVSVKDALPDAKGEYLCYLKPDIFTSFYGDSWDGNLAFRSVIAPTHWQPLPTPPTGGENE